MKIKKLDVELTSRCNLKCPFCFHTIMDLPKKDLNLSVFNKIDLNNITFIDVCGNVGEPVCHPEFFNFIDMIKDRTLIKISTNGSVHKEKWWSQLAKKLKRTRNSFIIFALDGLEETHIKHRVGANYKQTLKNIEAFNKAGGKSYAQLIIFKHNAHEVDDLKKVSKDLGCINLMVRSSVFYNDLYERPTEDTKTRHEACGDLNIKVLCKHLDKELIFIDFEGQVFPCCFLAGCKHSKKDVEVFSLYKKYINDIDLNKRTLEEILASKFYRYLHEKYQDIEMCQSFCKFRGRDFIKMV